MATRPVLGRMKNSFKEILDSNPRTYPGRDRFISWAKSVREPATHVTFSEYEAFRAGDPVRWEVFEAYSEHVFELGLPKVTVSEIADRLDSPVVMFREPWTRGWEWLKEKFARRFQLHPLAFCRKEAEVREAARLTVCNFGRMLQGNHLSDEEAEIAGNRAMKPPPGGYAEFLIPMWKRQRRTVMFAVDKGKRGAAPRRVGASVVLPLAQEAYIRLRKGEIDDFSLTPDDLATTSYLLHINAVAEYPLQAGETRFQRSQSQLHVCSWQMGMMSETIDECRGPSVIALAVSPDTEARARAYDFCPTEAMAPRIGKRVMELAPRPRGGGQRLERSAAYKAMCVLLMAYQTFNEDERELIRAGY